MSVRSFVLLGLLCVSGVAVAQDVDYTSWQVDEVVDDGVLLQALPQDKAVGSISVGDVSDGYLVSARRIADPAPNVAFLPIQFRRGLAYTTDELADLVAAAADDVAGQFDGAVVYLGNFSAPRGGDIPYSVSHNSGRDCDLAFFMADEHGRPFVPPDLVALDESGIWQPDLDQPAYHFDTPRNWALVASLLKHDQGRLQYIFVSEGLKKLLLDYARGIGADDELLMAADEILEQPGGALPHNDHFHLRVFCSDDDVWGGCVDQGRSTSRHRPDWGLRREAQRWASGFLTASDAGVRAAALQRLALLGARSSEGEIAKLLDDSDEAVRAAAARALGVLGRGAKRLARRLDDERDPNVRLELMHALSDVGGARSVEKLAALLEKPTSQEVFRGLIIDERALAADALARLEDARAVGPLIQALEGADEDLQARLQVALRRLTNQDFSTDFESWAKWYNKARRKQRDAWLVDGFKAAGFNVEKISSKYVWELCRAIDGPDWVSFNAQRLLMRIARRDVPSIAWSRADASFYWRRWFERRMRKYRTPPIPPEMSTLQPQQSVSSR